MAAGSSRFPRVAVLKGGMSAEREVSLSSGTECAKALRDAGYTQVIEVDAGRDLAAQLVEIKPDIVFNALHGRWGEDGCVQGILEWLSIPYTHSGVLASAIAMDKERTKAVYRAEGLPCATGVLASREAVEAGHVLPPPYVVKPYNEGSSVGVYIVHPGSNAPRLAASMPETVMVETYAPGRELSISVLGERALAVTDILTDGWYDYDAKYKPGGSRHQLPANMPDEITEVCLDYALRAHKALGCRGLSRTDIRWDEDRGLDGLILLETNTQPGMTPTSLAPEQAAHCGMSFAALCDWLVRDASCNR
ncbi:D-alanine--D-alanine ligase [Neotabrizicola sp. sgz301269]|uniref:D-alanine--D-alanine ligase n=1 Tax=Neotabrizicola sp. sgz301269 TaxID=3276282 RepID=UPI00377068DB